MPQTGVPYAIHTSSPHGSIGEEGFVMNHEEYIAIRNLTKIYRTGRQELRAVNDVSLTVEQGEIITILGPSGSGKSTLLNMIGGIDNADEGSILVDGIDIARLSKTKLTDYRRDFIGFIFQFYNLIPNLSVYENIEVMADICKNPLSIDELLTALGMADQAKKYPIELSGGQQQRVAIARAVVKNPPILLCDEPTGALDFHSSIDILKLIKEINEKYGTTILIITHNTAIAGIAHRTVKIRDGKIVFNGKNEKLIPVDELIW